MKKEDINLTLNYKVKFVNGTNLELDEIEGVQSVLLGNIENGNLELYRDVDKSNKADLPFFATPWQKIVNFNTEEKGTIGKKTYLQVDFQDEKKFRLELQEKISQKDLLADCIAFKKTAEEKFPKGSSEKAVESLAKVTEALGEAFGRGLNKAKAFGMGLKDKANKELKKGK